MKKTLLILTLLFISLLSFSQTTVKTEFKAKLSCSQRHGVTTTTGDFILTVIYDDNTIKFNIKEGQTMTVYTVEQKTEEYIIGKDGAGNYSFYDFKKKQFFCIDFFISRFTTAGYGEDSLTIKQTVVKMMDLLRAGKTQKDVIQNLGEK